MMPSPRLPRPKRPLDDDGLDALLDAKMAAQPKPLAPEHAHSAAAKGQHGPGAQQFAARMSSGTSAVRQPQPSRSPFVPAQAAQGAQPVRPQQPAPMGPRAAPARQQVRQDDDGLDGLLDAQAQLRAPAAPARAGGTPTPPPRTVPRLDDVAVGDDLDGLLNAQEAHSPPRFGGMAAGDRQKGTGFDPRNFGRAAVEDDDDDGFIHVDGAGDYGNRTAEDAWYNNPEERQEVIDASQAGGILNPNGSAAADRARDDVDGADGDGVENAPVVDDDQAALDALADELESSAAQNQTNAARVAGLGGFGLNGATAAQAADIGRADARNKVLALQDAKNAQEDQDFQDVQRDAVTYDNEQEQDRDLDDDGFVAGRAEGVGNVGDGDPGNDSMDQNPTDTDDDGYRNDQDVDPDGDGDQDNVTDTGKGGGTAIKAEQKTIVDEQGNRIIVPDDWYTAFMLATGQWQEAE